MTDESNRDSAGRFGPGNPGRPKGSRNAISASLDRVAEGRADEILNAVVEAALKGDGRCAEIVLKRIWPEPKGRALSAEVPGLADANDLVGKLGAIIAAVSDGSITPPEGHELVTLVEAQRRAHEAVDFERRLQALEAAQRERRE